MLVLLSLRTQYSNLGDQLINSRLAARLAADHELCCFTGGVPDWYRDEFAASLESAGVSARFVPTLAGLVLAILRGLIARQTICMFLSPGAMFAGQGSGLQRLMQFFLLSLIPRMRLAQVGASYEGLDPAGERLLRLALSRPNHISVRDEASQRLLAGHGLAVPLVPDLAFDIPRGRAGGRRFVMSFRASGPQAIDDLADRLAPLIAVARAQAFEPCFYWQVTADRATSEQLAARLDVPLMRTAGQRPTLDEALRFYSEAAVVCSNRLHGLLIASAAGATPFALLDPTEVKVRGAFALAGLESFVSTDREADSDILRRCLDPAAQHTVDTAFRAAERQLAGYFAAIVQADR